MTISDCVLVFTTTSEDHALDGYRVDALQYLVKPYSQEDLRNALAAAIKLLSVQPKYIEVQSERNTIRLPLKNILYAESCQHYVYIYLSDGECITSRTAFKDFSAMLTKETQFFRCSRGVLANLEQAEDFDGTGLRMKNGKLIAVSRTQVQAARAAFGEFLFQRRGR